MPAVLGGVSVVVTYAIASTLYSLRWPSKEKQARQTSSTLKCLAYLPYKRYDSQAHQWDH